MCERCWPRATRRACTPPAQRGPPRHKQGAGPPARAGLARRIHIQIRRAIRALDRLDVDGAEAVRARLCGRRSDRFGTQPVDLLYDDKDREGYYEEVHDVRDELAAVQCDGPCVLGRLQRLIPLPVKADEAELPQYLPGWPCTATALRDLGKPCCCDVRNINSLGPKSSSLFLTDGTRVAGARATRRGELGYLAHTAPHPDEARRSESCSPMRVPA